VDEDGPRRLTTGEVLTVTAERVLVRTCDAAARCSTDLVDPSSGARHPTDVPAIATINGVSGFDVPDGEIGLVTYDAGDGGAMWILDPTDGTVLAKATGVNTGSSYSLLPGSLGWIYADPAGGIGHLVRHGAGIDVERLEGLAVLRADAVILTRP
jgi:hypothetical protein